jgi:hypothetical protein
MGCRSSESGSLFDLPVKGYCLAAPCLRAVRSNAGFGCWNGELIYFYFYFFIIFISYFVLFLPRSDIT